MNNLYIYLICGWCEELTSVKSCEKQLEISHGTVVDWNNFMREVCVNSLFKREKQKEIFV